MAVTEERKPAALLLIRKIYHVVFMCEHFLCLFLIYILIIT